MKTKILCSLLFCSVSGQALAAETCTPAKDLIKMTKNFYGAGPDLTDVIAPRVVMGMVGLNGHSNPEFLLYRYEGEEKRLPVKDGVVQDLEKTVTWSKDGEICRSKPSDADDDTPTTQVSVSFMFPYKRQDGVFTMEEIKEGAKDGSKIMKGLAPGGLGFAVPGLKALGITPAKDSETQPEFTFTRDVQAVDVDVTKSGKTRLILLKDIKSAKADTLTISGGYTLSATFKFDPEEIAAQEAKRLAENPDPAK